MNTCFLCLFFIVCFSELKLLAFAVKLPGHGRPFGEHMPPMGVPVIGKFSSPQVFYGHFVRTNRPIHMKSAIQDTGHPGLEWTDEYMSERFGLEMVRVEIGKKEVRNRKAQWMRFNKFLNDYPHSDLYMVHSITNSMKELVQLPVTLQCGGFERSVLEAVMWMGKGPLRSVLHYDELDNLLCVFDGVKDVILIDQFYRDEVESHGFDKEGRFSTLDTESVDMYSFPQFQSLPWYRVHLSAGDCLYIPYKWYHQVTTFGNRSLAMNIWFSHLWWFHDETCEQFEAFPKLQPIEAFGGFASPNEAVRSHWLEKFLGSDDDVDFEDFSKRVSSGTDENKQKLFSVIDRDGDGLLAWEELGLFEINKAVLQYPDVFFLQSSDQNTADTVDNNDAKETSVAGDDVPSNSEKQKKTASNDNENDEKKHSHVDHEEL